MAEYPDLNCGCSRCQSSSLTGIERAALQPLKDQWAGRDMANDAPMKAYSLSELLERVDEWCEGDVE